jgi:hypothetical protein
VRDASGLRRCCRTCRLQSDHAHPEHRLVADIDVVFADEVESAVVADPEAALLALYGARESNGGQKPAAAPRNRQRSRRVGARYRSMPHCIVTRVSKPRLREHIDEYDVSGHLSHFLTPVLALAPTIPSHAKDMIDLEAKRCLDNAAVAADALRSGLPPIFSPYDATKELEREHVPYTTTVTRDASGEVDAVQIVADRSVSTFWFRSRDFCERALGSLLV